MFKRWFLLSLYLFASAAALPALASPHNFRLFQVFVDAEHSRPAQDLPYLIQLDGRQIGKGLTDKSGSIVTKQRRPRTRQEFVADIWKIGTHVLVVDSRNRISVKVLGNLQAVQEGYTPCSPLSGDCTGKGFYWIRLLGLDTQFASEPYSLTVSGDTLEGTVDNNGYIYVPADNPPKISEAMILRLCAGPALQIKIGTNIVDSEFVILGSSNVPAPSATSCKTSSLKQYNRLHSDLNKGMPYIFSRWASGSTPIELIEQRRRSEHALREDYRVQAASNDDRFAWLGTLPPTWSDDEYTDRVEKFSAKLKADMVFDMEDLLEFQCQTPAQVGPVPSMEAVEAYIVAYSHSTPDQGVLEHLYAAAAEGNWLAAAQVYAYENQEEQADKSSYLHKYRMLQLAEWLHARKIGGVYSLLGDALNASGFITDVPYYYAALHNGYSSQFKMGKVLAQAADSRYRLVGQKMQACALDALPAYKQYFKNRRDE